MASFADDLKREAKRDDYREKMSDAKMIKIRQYAYRLVYRWTMEEKISLLRQYGEINQVKDIRNEEEVNRQLVETLIINLPENELNSIIQQVNTQTKNLSNEIKANVKKADARHNSGTRANTQQAIERSISNTKIYLTNMQKGTVSALGQQVKRHLETLEKAQINQYAVDLGVSEDSFSTKNATITAIVLAVEDYCLPIIGRGGKGMPVSLTGKGVEAVKNLVAHTSFAWIFGMDVRSPSELAMQKKAAREAKARNDARRKLLNARGAKTTSDDFLKVSGGVSGKKKDVQKQLEYNDTGVLANYTIDELFEKANELGITIRNPKKITTGALKELIYSKLAGYNAQLRKTQQQLIKAEKQSGIDGSTDTRSLNYKNRTLIEGLRTQADQIKKSMGVEKSIIDRNKAINYYEGNMTGMGGDMPLVAFDEKGKLKTDYISNAVPVWIVGQGLPGMSEDYWKNHAKKETDLTGDGMVDLRFEAQDLGIEGVEDMSIKDLKKAIYKAKKKRNKKKREFGEIIGPSEKGTMKYDMDQNEAKIEIYGLLDNVYNAVTTNILKEFDASKKSLADNADPGALDLFKKDRDAKLLQYKAAYIKLKNDITMTDDLGRLSELNSSIRNVFNVTEKSKDELLEVLGFSADDISNMTDDDKLSELATATRKNRLKSSDYIKSVTFNGLPEEAEEARVFNDSKAIASINFKYGDTLADKDTEYIATPVVLLNPGDIFTFTDNKVGNNIKKLLSESEDARRIYDATGDSDELIKSSDLKARADLLSGKSLFHKEARKLFDGFRTDKVTPVYITNGFTEYIGSTLEKGLDNISTATNSIYNYLSTSMPVLFAGLQQAGTAFNVAGPAATAAAVLANVESGISAAMKALEPIDGVMGVSKFATGGSGEANNVSQFIAGDSLNGKPNSELVSVDWDNKRFSVKPTEPTVKNVSRMNSADRATAFGISFNEARIKYNIKHNLNGTSEDDVALKVYPVTPGIHDKVDVDGKSYSLMDLVLGMYSSVSSIESLMGTNVELNKIIAANTAANKGSQSAGVASDVGTFPTNLDSVLRGD